MIERFDVIGSADFEDRVNGHYVTYNDHADEMREVLEALNKLSEFVPSKHCKYAFSVYMKHAHYLEEK